MTKISQITLLSLLVLGFATLGTAQEEPATNEPTTEREFDREKFKERMKRRINRRDDRRLEKIDTNEDGQIDQVEFMTHSEERFRAMDIDSNGYVTREELQESRKAIRDKIRSEHKARKAEKQGE